MGTMTECNAAAAAVRSVPQHAPETHDLVRYATLAANSHNTQPWRFRARLHGIDIEADRTRRLAVVDPDDHHLFASLGCAAENLLIAAGASDKHDAVRFESRQPDTIRPGSPCSWPSMTTANIGWQLGARASVLRFKRQRWA